MLRALPRVTPAVAIATVVVAILAGTAGLGTSPAGAATTCTQDWRPAVPAAYLDPDGTATDPPRPLPPPLLAGSEAHHLFCGGHYITTAWVGPARHWNAVAVLGREVVRTARYPSVHPAVNPVLGITGLASWFWATADDAPLRMLRGNGLDLEIELRVASVRWRFGDGTLGSVGGWGSPYPAASAVTHVFERTGTFTVEAQVGLIGRVQGEELDVEWPGGHTVTLRHDVAQVRSLLHAG